ncbi:hypothetical protein MED134_03299 [Dokdonia sp. MED134]|uniref:hypothetical protein n=1 Tax=Dokdonia sp. MED134 TaxID=313590 RepID=UPI0000689C40|nr:hypothetical protein [Dokdonia sp. MED134]EAQ38305.1 hypothetical protein MED134_03299 [Dokdonia sp. MED134]
MRKTIVIALIYSFLISCGSNYSVSKIDRYVKKVDNRKDYSELIVEYVVEESSEHEITGGSEIYVLTDKNGIVKRIVADENESNRKPANFQFYFRDSLLIYSRIVEFNDAGTDTITDSNFYFKGEKLIKQKDNKKNNIQSEYIKEMAEYYRRKGK